VLPALLLAATGCEPDEPPAPSSDPAPAAPPAASAFDKDACGTVEGKVTWAGPLPEVPEFIYGMPKGDGSFETRMMPNPNAPHIDPATKAVAGAVVHLRGINPARAKQWDLPPVRVELVDRQIVVKQGDETPRQAGFVRRGDAVVMRSADPIFHVLRARGAAYFSLAFPDPDKPLRRSFDKTGRVELSSGAGYYWAAADLFVDDHPYYTHTDRDGRFTFTRVPAGPVEVVVRIPGWASARQERDPETGQPTRMSYTPAVGRKASVSVTAGKTVGATITVP
jgi:hypothetical protein